MGSDELVKWLRAQRPNGEPISVARLMDEAADRIEALTAQLAEARESERAATERADQAKLHGVRAGIEASAGALEADAKLCDCFARSEGECACGAWSDYKTVPMERAVDVVRALSAEAIAKGEGA